MPVAVEKTEVDGLTKATCRLMPLVVGKRLQEFGVMWIVPNTHLWVMGEIDV